MERMWMEVVISQSSVRAARHRARRMESSSSDDRGLRDLIVSS
jgi:hypothetical protein